ncbi:MAG: hypothetical protein WCY01_07120, partial [Alkalispirochaeta sp.]
IILSDEDPRGEDGLQLLKDIAVGCERARPGISYDEELFIIRDRREAIRFALSLGREGDTILFLGKGHEVSIVYADHVLDWDESRIVAEEVDAYRKADARHEDIRQTRL